ncbi:MAG: hypothetical protein E3J86_00880 [Candidatus Thorarchaeota archaeon]|nr:MAG: hypothetical protein E3J86_00880 [Candidatus Thorarchaeota archaeon]
MNKTSKLFALLVVTMMFVGATQTQMQTSFVSHENLITPTKNIVFSGYDSPNITVVHNSPVNGSTQSGSFNINVNITSDFGPLNLTLYVAGAIYSGYNQTTIGTGIQDINVDSTTLAEGMLNFTLFFEYLAEKESVYLLYFVDNDAVNFDFALYTPANRSELSGVVSIDINATHDYGNLNLTLLVDGVAQAPYTPALIPSGNVSVIIDTSALWEGYDNFTLLFEYDVLATNFSTAIYLEYLVDNDGDPITIGHQSPAFGSDVSGSFDLVLLIGSDYQPLNLTLYVEGEIQSDYNKTSIGIHEQTVSVNTTGLSEGSLNFTLVFEYNVTGENARVEYYISFTVNNHGTPVLVVLSPVELETITGLADLWLNITSTYANVYLNITVDGELVPEYNATLVAVGADNYTLNSSRYENGNHLVAVTVYTAEGEVSIIERELVFLDYVRIFVSQLSSYNEISGDAEINVRLETPFDNATLSLYIDGVLTEDVTNITLVPGLNLVRVNTTVFPEGESEFTFTVYDGFGHVWSSSMILVIDNHGPPILRFSTTADVLVGLAEFVVDVDTDWSSVYVSVYVDDEVLDDFVNVTADMSDGAFTFYIDVSAYSKAEHVVKIVIFTEEGEKSEIERVFGFASLRIEEIASGIVLLCVALVIPLYRWRKGQSIRSLIIVDIIFFAVVAGAFLLLGITSIPFLTWHVNLASIWAIGSVLVFTNWVLPFVMMEEE